MASTRRAVLFGHTGFIGAHLSKALRDEGIDPIGLSLPDVDLADEKSVKGVVGDITPDSAVLVLAGIKPAVANDASCFFGNVAIAVNVARILEESRPRRIIFFSSAAVYGEDKEGRQITESTPVEPMSFYGIAKYASERLIARAVDPATLVVLRPATIYGPGDQSRQYGPSGFVHAALTGTPVALWGDGSEQREFVYVADLVRIVIALLRSDRSGILNVVTGRSVSFADILGAIGRAGLRPLTVVRERTRPKVDHGFRSAVIDWVPGQAFTPLDEGVALTISAERELLSFAR